MPLWHGTFDQFDTLLNCLIRCAVSLESSNICTYARISHIALNTLNRSFMKTQWWNYLITYHIFLFPVPLSHLRRPQLSGDQSGVPARWQPAHLDGGPRHGHHAVGPVLKLGATVLFPECVRAKFRRPYASISEKKIRELFFARFKFRELFFVEVIFVSQKKEKRNFNRKQLGLIIWFNSKKITVGLFNVSRRGNCKNLWMD